MKDPEIDRVLEDAARAPHSVSPAVLDHIATSIHSSLHPVRPVPRTWVLTAGLLVLSAAVALGGAARSGLFGFWTQSVGERVIILSILAVLAGVVARELVSYWIPGRRHYLAPGWLVVLVSAALLSVFGSLFDDYHTSRFVPTGVICLSVGVLHAVFAACLAAWFLRRGLAVEPVSAGTIAGTFGGLSGVAMLELHCPNLEAPHVLFWHVAVVPVSAALGALVARAIITRKRG